MAYPVSLSVVPQVANRNRLTTAFRIVLALPHLILVGGVMTTIFTLQSDERVSIGGNAGVLGAIAWLLAVVSWFTILLSGQHVEGIREFTRFVVRWRARSAGYVMLLCDDYPPFGDGPYPVVVDVVDPPPHGRDRLTVALRLLLIVPHAIVLFFVLCGWWITTVIAWFAILITGRYPEGLYAFGVGVLRWLVRVEAYLLLLVDDYPPFALS